MPDLTRLIQELGGSPWLWVTVFLVVISEALLPFMPCDTTVVLTGVVIAPSMPNLGLLISVAAAGALTGDTLSYFLGRKAGPQVVARLLRKERGRHAYQWAQDQLGRRGRLLILFARYIPGGRMTTMSTVGALGFSPRWFLPPAVLSSLIWGTQASLLGFLGGSAFHDRPMIGMAASYGVVVTVMIGVGVTERLLAWRRRRTAANDMPSTPLVDGARFKAVNSGGGWV